MTSAEIRRKISWLEMLIKQTTRAVDVKEAKREIFYLGKDLETKLKEEAAEEAQAEQK